MSVNLPPVPPAPDEARGVFGERLPLVERYAEFLATAGVERGLIGPREAPRLWERHLLNCVGLSALIPEGATIADLGSGAGLPGVVIALARPDCDVTLVEPLLRRTTFLEEVVSGLGLEHVRVLRGRAEDLHGRQTFDVVTARALAPLDRLLRWAMPLVGPGGELLAMKGSSASEEIEQASRELATFGCGVPQQVTSSGTTVVRVSWGPKGPMSPAPGSTSSKKKRK